MLLEHPEHGGRAVRLAYCLNLHAADDLDGIVAGMERITAPLAERLGGERLRDGFGVGMYLPGHVAHALATEAGAAGLDRLLDFLADHRFDPFTYNAFPYGGFHREGLKEAVFRPTWSAPERVAYTLAVAEIALALRNAVRTGASDGGHLSISTHTGGFGAWFETDEQRDACADNMALVALQLAKHEAETGRRIVLSLEPEPRSLAGDTRALPALFERLLARSREVLARGYDSMVDVAEDIVRAHVGTCLDACHAAVEFEGTTAAYHRATSGGAAIGKVQFSSAIALPNPGASADARARLLAMHEPVYLHQVTGRRGDEYLRTGDLVELARNLDAGADGWLACDEWRCHFHVPVDLEELDGTGLRTTRAHADELLDAVLAEPERWGTKELHVEIETYTWDVLPDAARGTGDLVDGLEREYRHTLARLAANGWTPALR